MTSSLSDWLPDSFFRKPSWRWYRARHLVRHQRNLDARFDDEWVDHARQYRAMRSPLTQPDLSLPSRERWCAIGAARRIWLDRDSPDRDRLEAHLLTQMPIDQIADVCDLPESVVEAYDKLFFDVRSRFKHRDWIIAKAIGVQPWIGFHDASTGDLWRYFAYMGGPLVLEVVIAVTTGAPMSQAVLESFKDPARDEARLRAMVELMIDGLRATTAEEWKTVSEKHERLRPQIAELCEKRMESGIVAIVDDVLDGDIAQPRQETPSCPETTGKDQPTPGESATAAA